MFRQRASVPSRRARTAGGFYGEGRLMRPSLVA